MHDGRKIITRAEAISLGLQKYFTGKPCIAGHVADRYVSAWSCSQCVAIAKRVAAANRTEPRKKPTPEQRHRILENKRKPERLASQARWAKEYAKRPEVIERNRNRYKKVKRVTKESAEQRERRLARLRSEEGRAKSRAYRAKRRAAVARAAPDWADINQIREFYRACPPGHHVDHFVPIKGKTHDGRGVCGLHVQSNLRYLPAGKNQSRCNRMSAEETAIAESVSTYIDNGLQSQRNFPGTTGSVQYNK